MPSGSSHHRQAFVSSTRFGASCAVLAMVLLLPSTSRADGRSDHGDDGECNSPGGDFTASPVVVGCVSPFGFCTHGLLTGGLEATYDFVMTSSIPAPTAEHPSRIVYAGYSVVQTADGAVFGADSGEMWFEGGIAFVTTVGIVGGDECFEDAEGTIVASGVIDPATGNAVGTYTSQICDAQECLDPFGEDEDEDEDEQ